MKLASIVKAPLIHLEIHVGTPPTEIWLRPNLRPVVWLVVAAVVVSGGLCLAVWAVGATAWLLLAAACVGVPSAFVALLATAAARPRLQRVGDHLRIRLAPTGFEEVPLDAVECFFLGSSPITRSGVATCGGQAAFRVNTLVLRLAERASDYAARPTFTPWGTWDDGYAVFDGRWCEPLSADLARQLSRKLLDAKRSPGEAGSAAAAGVGP